MVIRWQKKSIYFLQIDFEASLLSVPASLGEEKIILTVYFITPDADSRFEVKRIIFFNHLIFVYLMLSTFREHCTVCYKLNGKYFTI